jgi:hypothetical protein
LKRLKGSLCSEVNMLDLFYVGLAIAFFALLWGFAKATERL